MENFKKMEKIELDVNYHNGNYVEGIKLLQVYLNNLNKCFDREQNNLAEIAYYVYQVKWLFIDYNSVCFGRVYTKHNKEYTFDTIMQGFGLDSTQVSRLISLYDKFVEVDNDVKNPKIKNFVLGFSKSKLFELLVVDREQIQKDVANNVLRPDMSVKTIREYVKNYKLLQKQNIKLSEEHSTAKAEEAFEEEIPPAYNPQQHYDFEYFEKKSKAELLNMIWDLQKAYEKLVNTNSKAVSSSAKSSSKTTTRKKNAVVDNVKNTTDNVSQEKSLTIDELKKLEAGGVLLRIVNIADNTEFYACVVNSNDCFDFEDCLRVDVKEDNKSMFLRYTDYGTTWLAYRAVGLNVLFKN